MTAEAENAAMSWSLLDAIAGTAQRWLGTVIALGLLVLIYLALRQEHAPPFESLVPVQARVESASVGPVRGRAPAVWLEAIVAGPDGSRRLRFRGAAGDADAQISHVRPGGDVTLWVQPGFAEAASTPIAYQIETGVVTVLSYDDARDAAARGQRRSMLLLVPAAVVVAAFLWWWWRT